MVMDRYSHELFHFFGETTNEDEDVAGAEFVVRAVNAHDDLVAALESLVNGWEQDGVDHDILVDKARAALAKARGDNA